MKFSADQAYACDVKERVMFGYKLYYPCNSLADNLAKFIKRRSFSEDQLKIISDLGFNITIERGFDADEFCDN